MSTSTVQKQGILEQQDFHEEHLNRSNYVLPEVDHVDVAPVHTRLAVEDRSNFDPPRHCND